MCEGDFFIGQLTVPDIDASHLRVEKGLGQLPVGRKVKVSEKNLPFAQQRVFGRKRVFPWSDAGKSGFESQAHAIS